MQTFQTTLPYLLYATALFSFVAAIFTGLIFFRHGKEAGPAAGNPVLERLSLSEQSIQDTIRHEADRSRADSHEQARTGRQESAEGFGRLQDSMLQKLDAANLRASATARELREELTGNFAKSSEQLSATLVRLGAQQREQLEKVEKGLAQMAETQGKAQEVLRQAVEGRLDAIRQENTAKLDEVRKTVDEKLQSTLEQRIGESFRTVSEQLERVYKGLGEMQSLATGVGDLKRVLSNVKTRGTWGEVQLGMLLEQFLSPDQYISNAQVREHSGERVEFVIRFPGRDSEDDVLLPIDAKFPQEDLERLILATENADADATEIAAKALEMRVRSFAKSISEKYINPPMTTDYAILFLPTESLFAEVLRRPGLFEDLQSKYRVTVSGPTTLAALLSAFQMGFRSMAIQKRSSEVWKVLGAVRGEFEKHGEVVDRLKTQLNAATNTIDKLGTRTRVMRSKLKDIEVLPNESVQSLLGLEGADSSAMDDLDEESATAES